MTRVHLSRALFGERERTFLETDGATVSLFRYDTGVEAVRLANALGHVVVLPYLGQMVWDVRFAGVGMTMGSMFAAPRPATQIADTVRLLRLPQRPAAQRRAGARGSAPGAWRDAVRADGFFPT